MQLWVGLGNPGAKYALQRHNVGFMAADILAEVHDFGPWQKKFRSLIAEGRIGRQRVLLLKPQTFMNDSGDAVQQALRFYKLELDALTVFHDELDLAPFKVKVRVGGGLAGHNGLRSIDASLGPEFRRCASASAIPDRAARTSSPPTCSAIMPSPRWSLYPICSPRSAPKPNGSPMGTTRDS